jgi:hypothetical protein
VEVVMGFALNLGGIDEEIMKVKKSLDTFYPFGHPI